jgi:hypothetical protein
MFLAFGAVSIIPVESSICTLHRPYYCTYNCPLAARRVTPR